MPRVPPAEARPWLLGWPTARRAAAVALILMLGGCFNTWPEHGRGGMAELRAPDMEMGDEDLPLLMAGLDRERSRLAQVRHRHGEQQAPAHLAEADLLAARIHREIAGGLTTDAQADLRRLSAAVVRIEDMIAGASGGVAGIPVPLVQAAKAGVAP